MELAELTERLVPFCREHLGDPAATVSDVYKMPGQAGFSYGFTAHANGKANSYYMRVPPPNVRLLGIPEKNGRSTMIAAPSASTTCWPTPTKRRTVMRRC